MIRYLQMTKSAKVDSTGKATVSIRPDVGQFWAPSIVRVSTGMTPQNTNYMCSSYCSLHHGAVGGIGFNPNDSFSYIDDTYTGSGDSSSVIAGTIVQYGEAITAQWVGAPIGDTAVLSVYGRSADNLPELQSVLPPIPGAKFSGNVGNGMVWDYNSSINTVGGNLSSAPPSLTLPSDCLAEIVHIEYDVTTDATVGTRRIGTRAIGTINGISSDIFRVANNTANHGASSTLTYSYAPSIQDFVSGVTVGTALPAKLILPPGFQVTVLTSSLGAADTWNNFLVVWRQYKTLTKVAFT